MIKKYRFLLLLPMVQTVLAQSPSYLHFTVENGLPGNLIYCAVQDREGYTWFGTDKGLSRYDGERFYNYTADDGLPDLEVLNLYEDYSGKLWIACFRQKLVYRYQGRFVTEQEDAGLNELTMRNAGYVFTETQDSALWIVSGGAISCREERRSAHYLLKNVDALFRLDSVLLGVNGSQIFRIKKQDERLNQELLMKVSAQKWANSYTFSGNRILYAFPDQTILLEYQQGAIKEIARSNTVFQTVYTDRNGRFWGAAPGKGAVCFNNQTRDLSNPQWYLAGKKISGIYHDHSGNFWFLSSGEGIFMLPSRQTLIWSQEEGLPSSNILALVDTPQGVMLAGDDLGNVHHVSGGVLKGHTAFGAPDGTNFVRQIAPVAPGKFWVASDDCFGASDQSVRHRSWKSAEGVISAGAPKAVIYTPAGLWFGSSQGLALLGPGEQMPQLVMRRRITSMATDSEQYLWAGGIDGLYSQADQFKTNVGDQFEHLKTRIVTIAAAGPGRIWVVTPVAGLLEVSVSKGAVLRVTPVNARLSKPVLNIKKVFTDEKNVIWLATNQGVCRIDTFWQTTFFTKKHGLAGNEVNDLLVRNDTLWAACTNGLCMLDLQTFQSSPKLITRITGFQYLKEDSIVSFDFSGKNKDFIQINLRTNDKLPQVWCAGLNAQPGDILYYRHIQARTLLPFPWYTFGNIWSYLNARPDTLFIYHAGFELGHNLAAGRYLMTTTAFTFHGGAAADARWELNILPVWYETIWVWLAVLAAVILSAWRFYYLRTRLLRMESTFTQLKHQALKAQINPHFIGNSINAIQKFFYPPDPEKASEYIYLFTMLLRKTIYFSERDFIPFQAEIAYQKDYLEMIKLRYDRNFRYEISVDEHIDPRLPFPTMMVQPILENATIHGLSIEGNSVLRLHYTMQHPNLICTVTDNGQGIHAAAAQKNTAATGHQSKGIKLLEGKKRMLNNIYHINLTLRWRDLGDTPGVTGTEVLISFNPFNAPAESDGNPDQH